MGEGSSARPSDPGVVWKLVERADELVKYAQNRDPSTAYAQARRKLAEAIAAAGSLPSGPAAEGVLAQIERRLQDLDRLEGGSA